MQNTKFKNVKLFLCLCLLAVSTWSFSQSTYVPLNPDYYHLVDRYEILSGKSFPGHFSGPRPYLRKEVAYLADSLSQSIKNQSASDRFNFEYLQNDNWEWSEMEDNESRKPFLKHFYKVKSDLYHVASRDFDLHVNPVLHLAVGRDSRAPATPFINTRGVEIRGMIDQKVGFYSFLGENQANFPGYVVDRIDSTIVVPHEGFWKDFNDDGYDFFTARGYITFNATRHIAFQFGHDQNFIGNGYRSLVLSNFAPPHLFLKINTRVWKLNYMNLFTKMTSNVFGSANGLSGSRDFPGKYMSLHHLSVDISPKLNVGVFESVIFSREDSLGNNPFDLNYLNPIIFYRAIEQQGGSPDNVILGMDFKWHVAPRFLAYGQFILDEFVLEELRNSNGWWGNKFGFQLGGEYINAFGIDNFDVQLETNWVRPYAYTHDTEFGSYTHYRQPLAHPRGANFREFLAILRYQPLPRLSMTATAFVVQTGSDTLGLNVGTDILLPNDTRNNGEADPNFGNEIAQGIDTDIIFGTFTATYQFKHNLFADLTYTYRDEESALDERSNTTNFLFFSLRWNIPKRLHEF